MDKMESATNPIAVSVPVMPPNDKPSGDEKPTSMQGPAVDLQKGEVLINVDHEFAAMNFFASRDLKAYRCDPPFYADPLQSTSPVPGQRVYLVCGRNVKNPGVYGSWPSADAEYKGVSGATLKGYTDRKLLNSAWHARCDLGEHSHPANPVATHMPPSPTLSVSRMAFTSPTHHSPPTPRTPSPSPPPRTPSPLLQTYAIDSNSPSPSPTAIPAGSRDPPAYAPGETVYAVRVGTCDGEIFTRADEARARFIELRSAGGHPRLAVSPSVDRSLAWIDGTSP
ncbi:hypothetical protein B0H11DRAFT_2261106 [Mycena galericulata]|nr:hypothetical protein B0H11DRAFT_2261106 [Mycena galericulata]